MENICSICLDKIKISTQIDTVCKHFYHKYCLDIWLQNNTSCPLCRQQIKDINIFEINKIYEVQYKYTPNYFRGKLLEIIKNELTKTTGYRFSEITNSLWPMPDVVYVFSNIVNIIDIQTTN
jgi:hypothetical protein